MENMKVPRWKVVKAVLMLRRCGNTSKSKEEQIAEQLEWLKDPEYAKIFDEWIDSLREDLKKTPEQREKESEEYLEELLEREAEQVREEMLSMRHDRDEWDDYWDDIARSVGAKMIMEPATMYNTRKSGNMENVDSDIRKQRIKNYDAAIECKQYIEKSIREGYDYSRSHLDTSSAVEAVKKYGTRNVEIVLGLTIYDKSKWDGRFSRANLEWAARIHESLTDEEKLTFMVRDKYLSLAPNSHSGLLDMYTTEARNAIQNELKLNVISEDNKTSSAYDFDEDNILVSGQGMEQNGGSISEAILLSQKTENTYGIYQLRDLHHGGSDEDLFMGLDYLRKKGINSPDPRKYDYVYGGRIDDLLGSHNAIQDEWLLEMIFQKLNVGEKPEGYFGRSLSVSDIVVINRSGERKAYFVDRIGFKELPEFVHDHERETCIADSGIKATKKTAKKRKGR